MKFIKYIMPVVAVTFFSGCEFFDEMFNFDTQQQKVVSEVSKIEFQAESDPKTALITADCKYNTKPEYVYYETQQEASENYFKDTKNYITEPWSGKKLKPFWDVRYVNEVKKYSTKDDEYANISTQTGLYIGDSNSSTLIATDEAAAYSDASLVSSKCIDGVLAGGTTINLFDAPEQSIEYAGPQTTLMYRLADLDVAKAWDKNGTGNLMIQAKFNKPIYKKFDKNMGGGVNFGVFLYNKKLKKEINYIIGVYTVGSGWLEEQAKLKFDPTTHIVHVATSIDNGSWWSTKSPKSDLIVRVQGTKEERESNNSNFKHFYRANITYDNLKAVLRELKNNPPVEAAGEDFGLNPEDWQVESIYLQYELEEDGGKAILSGSFKGFEAYKTKLPL